MSFGTIQIEKMTTESGYSLGAGNASSFKNRIINGAMVIDQRNAGASVNPGTGSYSLDRWFGGGVHDGVLAFQQVSDAPTGYTNSFRATVSTADASLGASQYARFGQVIEGYNVSDFAAGTASAATVTLSFWVKSSLTGTFGGVLANSDETRDYVFQYTINAANTWEQKSVTVTLSTSGTWVTNNGIGLRIFFSLGAGSNYVNTANTWVTSYAQQASGNINLLNTLNATWQMTGAQLEVGTVATSFDYRPYGTELQLCQRYYYRISTSGSTYQSFGLASPYNATQMRLDTIFPVTMRTAPSALDASAASSILYEKEAGYALSPTVIALGSQSNAFVGVSVGTIPSSTAGGAAYHTYSNGTPAYLGFSAEL